MKKILLLASLSLLLVGCGGSKQGTGLKGEVLIDGSSTVAPISQAVAEEFSKENSDVNVSVGISGTGGGIKKFVSGEIDIADASRAMKPEELSTAQKNGIEFIELKIGLDGLTVVANPENTWAQNLTTEDLKKIWADGSTVKTWKDVNPAWPAEPIKLYGPDQDSGTYDYFIEEILGKDGKIRKDYSPSSDDNQLVQGVEGDKGALGYFGYAYYLEQKDKLKALSINGISPSDETVKNGTYKPLSRPLYIYINKKSFTEKAQVKSFVQFYIKNAAELVKSSGYVPLDDYDAQEAAIK
ncbi:MAG: PstS family phosphate ABC transporter substrate-binding protein [Leptotrichiaceae bacterium]|jgi:phosphate transport system substrate-binding protein